VPIGCPTRAGTAGRAAAAREVQGDGEQVGGAAIEVLAEHRGIAALAELQEQASDHGAHRHAPIDRRAAVVTRTAAESRAPAPARSLRASARSPYDTPMPTPGRVPLPFTFGNHMHWVDMQWLWGYQVLPDSLDDMLALCRAVGARGNVNFDGIGYEKLAAEDPEALARLREAVAAGTIEVVGASYGQPYGLFCGGESNVRQRVVGARTVRRLLGTWPRTFWEEEFDFCPQLPQILAGCGFTGASLFFQWTWHTPIVPEENVPLVQWEGVDGTRLPALARTQLCLHQWPEDFDGRLELAARTARPALVQWLELMPSPDWMCRSEVLLGRLRELFADPRFQVVPLTAGGLIRHLAAADTPVRCYTMDDVFHGMTIGKNGDCAPRRGDAAEAELLAAESLAAAMGLLGRPYASWDVYPAWELDEGWRELLAGQHHDNHECEGLCGSIGKTSLARAQTLAGDVHRRHLAHLARQVAADGDRLVVHNPLGFERTFPVALPEAWGEGPRPVTVPAFGWTTVVRGEGAVATGTPAAASGPAAVAGGGTMLRGPAGSASFDGQGRLRQLAHGARTFDLDLGRLCLRCGGAPFDLGPAQVVRSERELTVRHRGERHDVTLHYGWLDDGLELAIDVARLPRPDPGFGGALRLVLGGLGALALRHDTPYAVTPVAARGEHVRKYPSGDWMTSKQWFETVRGAFTARTFVDAARPDGSGVLCAHDGTQGWFRSGDDLEAVLHVYDPWDEDRWIDPGTAPWRGRFLLVPHGSLGPAVCVQIAEGFRAAPRRAAHAGPGGAFPPTFGALRCAPAHVLVTAFHREHKKAFEHVENAFGPAVRNPFVVRLVEFDGRPADVELQVPGPCPLAARTDLLGALVAELRAAPCTPPPWSPPGLPWSALRFRMRPREIATVMLDLELGRHAPRDLDAHRHVWATVHRR